MSSGLLESAVSRLDARIRGDARLGPGLFAQMLEAERSLGLLHGSRPVCPFLRPYLLARSQYDRVARAAETLARAFERVAEAALRDDGLMAELGLTEREAGMARFDPGYARLCVTSRLDAFLAGEDFKFLEYNAESPAGLADQMLLEKVMFGLPHVREFLEEYAHWSPAPHRRLLRALVETYREWGGEEERPNVAVVDWEGVSTESEFFVLRDYFETEGFRTVVADPRRLSYDGDTLKVEDFRVDVLYKRVIIHEFLERSGGSHPLARAYADGKVCMANSFRPKLVHKKASFAVLTDPSYEHLFTQAELDCIREHVPWTRNVRRGRTVFEGTEQDLPALMRRERERLVLKPNDDYGGHGIHIGWETGPEEWDRAIETALAKSYVVQERVPVRKVSLPMFDETSAMSEKMLVDFDPFLFLNEVEGGLVRLSGSSLCNITSGGGETALLVLENA